MGAWEDGGRCKTSKQQIRIMWSGTRLWVILHTEHRAVGQAHPFDCAVIQILVRDFHVAGQCIGINCVVVVLRRDLHIAHIHIADRLVAAMMPKFELIGVATQSAPDNLMPQTDAKGGYICVITIDPKLIKFIRGCHIWIQPNISLL